MSDAGLGCQCVVLSGLVDPFVGTYVGNWFSSLQVNWLHTLFTLGKIYPLYGNLSTWNCLLGKKYISCDCDSLQVDWLHTVFTLGKIYPPGKKKLGTRGL